MANGENINCHHLLENTQLDFNQTQGNGVPWVNALGGTEGDDRCPMRGSEATERGEGVGGVGGGIHGKDFFQN